MKQYEVNYFNFHDHQYLLSVLSSLRPGLRQSYIVSIYILINNKYDYFVLKTVADVECGVSKTRSGKIVNGVDAVKGEFPW